MIHSENIYVPDTKVLSNHKDKNKRKYESTFDDIASTCIEENEFTHCETTVITKDHGNDNNYDFIQAINELSTRLSDCET